MEQHKKANLFFDQCNTSFDFNDMGEGMVGIALMEHEGSDRAETISTTEVYLGQEEIDCLIETLKYMRPVVR